jgi:hypothetical protein
MTFKRKVLAALTRLELLEVGRAVELEVTLPCPNNKGGEEKVGGRSVKR